MKKYKIDEYLKALPVRIYRKSMRFIPVYLEVSLTTFCQYKNIEIDSPRDIPYCKVVLMEKLFGFAPGELSNVDFTEKKRTLSELIEKNTQLPR